MSKVATPAPWRRLYRVGTVVLLLALAAAGAWYGWLWYSTPSPPVVPLAGRDAEVADAIGAARRKVLNDGRSATAWGAYGMALGANGFGPESLVCFTQAERLDPKEPRWPFYQGMGLMRRDVNAALPFLQRAVALSDKRDWGNDGPRLFLAEALMQTGAYGEAEEQLGRVLTKDPENPHAHYDWGLLAETQQDGETAARHFIAAAASPYARQKACASLAVIYQRRGDEAAAAKYNHQASAPPKDRPWEDQFIAEYMRCEASRQGRFGQAEELQAAGRFEDALAIYVGLAEDATDAQAQIAAGEALFKLGRLPEAEGYFRAAVGQKTWQAEANFSLGFVLYREAIALQSPPGDPPETAQVRFREAVACTDRVLHLKHDHAMAYQLRGLSLKGLGRKIEAIASFRQAILLRPELMEPHLELGEMLAEDDPANAAVQMRLASDLAPDDPRPRKALARILGTRETPQ